MQNIQKQKIVDFLYEKSINTTGRRVEHPKDDSNITFPISINIVNIGIDVVKQNGFVRTNFSGSSSSKFYTHKFSLIDYEKWCNRLSVFADIKFEDDFDSFEKEQYANSDNSQNKIDWND